MDHVSGVDDDVGAPIDGRAVGAHQQPPVGKHVDGRADDRVLVPLNPHAPAERGEPTAVLVVVGIAELVERLEHRREQGTGIDPVGEADRLGGRPAHIDTDPHDHVLDPPRAASGLGEHARQLPGAHDEVVGPLDARRHRRDPLAGDRRSNGHPLGEPVGAVDPLTEEDRHEQVRPRWGLPAPVETTTSSGLVECPEHGPVGCPGGPRLQQVRVRRASFPDDLHAPCWLGSIHRPTLTFVLKKILIANRGEIAVRVIRAARELGIKTVAVYSELDRDALHVRLADEAYALGGQTAAESYLNTAAILDAIKRSGADGVHPGYGFFSENADFARAIEAEGVAFIGPPPAAIEEMGDKVSSRKAALRGGAPIVPGTTDFVTTAEEIAAFGKEFGFPVAIKAAFGGGGRGMKVVHSAEDVQAAMESAQREARNFFGRDEIYVEKYLTWPRHVEVQLVGDKHGNCVWVSTRDCSAQRRHQKLIEEAPAPALPPGVEDAMGEAAIKAAKAVGYYNAGTVEFIYQDGEFFFLEMNTRLQVEHPVTEVITGIDLVEWQIRVASGESLPMTQEQVAAQRRGHGIEIRINAENPASGKFLPSPGKITALRAPDGFGVRFDAGYEAGDEVSQYYDNLVGKLIVWGKDRPTAIARTIRALNEMTVEGVATTIPADLAILEHPDFAAVTHSTKWVEERLDLSGIAPAKKPEAAGDDDAALVERRTTVEVNGKRFDVKMWVPDAPVVAVSGGGAAAARKPARSASGGGGSGGSGSGDVAVPMQGTIVKVLVEVGQTVEVGQPVVVLEAMKMENQINAEKAGTVKEVKVEPGAKVGAGDVVVVIA